VYKCTDMLGVRYACKVLSKSKNTRKRVHNEVTLMKMLGNSPKVVRFHDVGENESNYYIIQEWCRGGTVKEYITDYENYGENTVSSIIRGVLRGLVHMNEARILHRDIKGSNIMLGDKSIDADVKIGDFGAAIQMDDELVDADSLVGTPWFMPPEALSNKYHVTSDVWSVGVLTYQLLSGSMPFNDFDNQFNPRITFIWRSILTGTPKLSGRRWEMVSQDAKDFIEYCLVRDYRDRPNARQCLDHAWLRKTDCNDRFRGVPLDSEPFKYEDTSLMLAKTIHIEDS
jgi:calcium-dependent protein kinase